MKYIKKNYWIPVIAVLMIVVIVFMVAEIVGLWTDISIHGNEMTIMIAFYNSVTYGLFLFLFEGILGFFLKMAILSSIEDR